MALNIKRILFFAVVSTVLLFPFAVDYYTTNQLQNVKVLLNKDGVDFDVLSKHGLIETQREIVFTISDGAKVAKKTIKELKKSYSNYNQLFQLFDNTQKDAWNKVLKGTKFTGYIVSNNYLLKQPTIELSLKELSTELMKEIRKDPEISKIVLPMLSEEALSANIILDLAGNIKNIKLKDIDESINLNRNNNMKIELVGNSVDVLDENIIKSKVDKQYFQIKGRRSTLCIETKNIKTYQDFKDFFEQKSKLSFENFSLIGLTKSKQEIISIGKASMNDEITSHDNLIDTKSKYNIDDISFTANNLNILSLNSVNMDIKLNNIKKSNLEDLLQTYSRLIFAFSNEDKDVAQINFVKNVLTFLNNGFSLEAHSKFDKLYFLGQLFKKIKLDINSKLVKNTLGVNSKGDTILNYLNIDAKLVLDEQSAQKLSRLSYQFNKYMKYGKDENKNKIFNISFKNSNLKINNKNIQYN